MYDTKFSLVNYGIGLL